AVARDGVRVPYTIVRRANAPRDGSGYVLMSGYGCFGTVNSPFYWPALEAWLEQGGIFVLAHIRGGGELGAGWHLAGSDRNKATSFEDAIDTARQLVRNGWTHPGRIGVTGGSCGGATMGMAALEAPHLIGAAALSAAALDMNRIAARTTAGARSIREFGDLETPEGARRIDALSPYRQLLPGAPRPAFLIMSGATDYTIPLWVGGKFVASARAANPAEAPVLWRIDWSSGHNVGRDYAAEDADLMAFMLWQLGHPEFRWADGE
ncbi:MAG TPA: prolyl oligopeptidase family serine peptidase, partial [Allosphingosinicella sp.]|nr:prolyl oligopeptidase family serine peptidase [Allosphingosinicella sp.]